MTKQLGNHDTGCHYRRARLRSEEIACSVAASVALLCAGSAGLSNVCHPTLPPFPCLPYCSPRGDWAGRHGAIGTPRDAQNHIS